MEHDTINGAICTIVTTLVAAIIRAIEKKRDKKRFLNGTYDVTPKK